MWLSDQYVINIDNHVVKTMPCVLPMTGNGLQHLFMDDWGMVQMALF